MLSNLSQARFLLNDLCVQIPEHGDKEETFYSRLATYTNVIQLIVVNINNQVLLLAETFTGLKLQTSFFVCLMNFL